MLPLFAAKGDDALAGFAAMGLLLICGCLAIGLTITIFFLLTLQKALSRCSPQNRTMEPGMVWLNLIPLFHIVWCFITVSRISESLQREFRARGMRREGDYGQTVGMTWCSMNLAGVILNFISRVVPIVGLLGLPIVLIEIICFIIYWVKIAGYSGQLARRVSYDYGDDGDYEDDDHDDDRPRRRRDRDDDDDDDRGGRPWDRGAR